MRNWTPVRKGDIYCSPACGADCTYGEYIEATKKAEQLAIKCSNEIGGKWEIRVSENLGWHYEVILSETNIAISYGGYLSKQGDYYTVGFSGGTPMQVSTHPETFKTPKEAFDAQTKLIKEESDKWNNRFEKINKALRGF